MRFSLRQRLLLLTVLGTIAFAAALLTIVRLTRSGHEQRIEHAHEVVETEIERLKTFEDTLSTDTGRRRIRAQNAVRSGYLDASFPVVWPARGPGPIMQDLLVSMRAEADASANTVVRETEQRDGTLVIALARLPSTRYVWAAIWVAPQRASQIWRLGLLVLSLATLALVLASLQTLVAFRRGASELREGLGALEKDLHAAMARPAIRELGEVADGISHLAGQLVAAQTEHERLTHELAQRERLASLGRVAAGVAHEVRNPLASMKLRVDLAGRAKGLPPEVANDLSEVSGEIQRLDRIVSDLLAITGRRVGQRVRTDLYALAAQRVALLEPWAEEHAVKLVLTGAGSAEIERDAVGRALDNLLRNAVQASPRGSTVAVDVIERDDRVVLTVSDHGPGVPHERERELFEPFFTTRAEGTGLGLALSRSIAAVHGGTLIYERGDEQTRFVLSVPSRAVSTERA